MIIGFDAKRIVRNGTGLGNYCRTLINDMIRCNDGRKLLLYTPDKGRDALRNQIVESENCRFVYPTAYSASARMWYNHIQLKMSKTELLVVAPFPEVFHL